MATIRIHDAQMNCSHSSRKFLLSKHLNGIIPPLLLCMYILHTVVRLIELILTWTPTERYGHSPTPLEADVSHGKKLFISQGA